MSCTGYTPLIKTVVQDAIGDRPPINATVKIHIKQLLSDGTMLSDSLVNHPTGTLIDLKNTKVLSSLIDELLVMVPGEISQFICKRENMNSGLFSIDLPPGQDLVMEVEMLDWFGEDISVEQDNSLVKVILEEGTSTGQPCWTGKCQVGVSRYGATETEVLFRLGDGLSYKVPPEVELCVLTMNRNEKCRVTTSQDISYTIRLFAFEKERALYKLDRSEVTTLALELKARGNAAYTACKLRLAQLYYERCIVYTDSIVKSEQTDETSELARTCYLNLSQVYLKLEDFPNAMSNATTVLWTDPKNLKALYRRALAYKHIGFLDEARTDLSLILSIDPDHGPSKSLLGTVSSQKQREELAERQKLQAVFLKIDEENKVLAAAEPPVKSVWEDAMETCPDELATEEAYLEYKAELDAEEKTRKEEEAVKKAAYEAANPPKKKKNRKKKKKPATSEVTITETEEVKNEEVVPEPVKDEDDLKYEVTAERSIVNKIGEISDELQNAAAAQQKVEGVKVDDKKVDENVEGENINEGAAVENGSVELKDGAIVEEAADPTQNTNAVAAQQKVEGDRVDDKKVDENVEGENINEGAAGENGSVEIKDGAIVKEAADPTQNANESDVHPKMESKKVGDENMAIKKDDDENMVIKKGDDACAKKDVTDTGNGCNPEKPLELQDVTMTTHSVPT